MPTMEEILSKILVPDSAIVNQATIELKEAFKQDSAIGALCEVVVSSSNPQIRQSASVLLRRKLSKKRQWTKLNVNIRNSIKQGLLQVLVNEQEKPVKNSVAQLIGVLGKHELPNDKWPEVLQFLHNLCSSSSLLDKEMGMYSLSIMTDMSYSCYIKHFESFGQLFTDILNSVEPNSTCAYYTIVTMKNFVPSLVGQQQQQILLNVYLRLMPKILETINAFATGDEKMACDSFEILEELIEYAIVVVAPHVKLIVDMCLHIGRNNSIETGVQIKAISVVGWLIRAKGKIVQKQHLVEPIIDVLIDLMAQKPVDEKNEEYFQGDPDQFTTITVATQTLDLIALHIPAEKVVPYLLTKLEPALRGEDPYGQKAAYLSLAVLAEGCSERIRTKYLNEFLKCVCAAIHNPNPVVRNAALFAFGQFAEHLQPEISQFASDLLPLLFQCLTEVLKQMEIEHKDPASLDRLFYALETFCENLEEKLVPYLPTLLDQLFLALNPDCFSIQLKRVALSALSAAVTAVKVDILPYFQKIIEILNFYINNSDSNSPIHQVQCYAIEALSVVARYVGPDNFKPLANESLQLGLRLLTQTEDPDVKKSVYSLFTALAIVMKEDLSPALPKIVQSMIASIYCSEGITSHYTKDEDKEIDVYGDLSDDDDDDEQAAAEVDIDGSSTASDDSTAYRYTVENSYNEEKEQACLALREICINTGPAFLPYIEQSFEEIFKLINYPQDDIRRSAIETLEQFCVFLHKSSPDTKQALYKALQLFIPKCYERVRFDDERAVVITCLDTFGVLLTELKSDVFVGEGHREAIMNCIVDVLTMKTTCQDTDLAQTEQQDDEAEAEQDELLLESAGDIIPKYGSALTPDDFACYFPNILKLLSSKTVKQNSVSQRSFSYGILAECMKPLDVYMERFVPELLRLWLIGAKDSSDEVRNNAIYGVGEMLLYGKDRVFRYYNEILNALSKAVSKETHPGTLDNICGAIAKMIIANSAAVPLEHVFPTFISKLPLRTDFQENEAVINCFCTLFHQSHPVVGQHLDHIIQVAAHVWCLDQYPNDETKLVLAELLGAMHRSFRDVFVQAVSKMGMETTQTIQKLLA